MSNIPLARDIIRSVLTVCDIDRGAKVRLGKALRLMTREPYAQRVPGIKQRINWRKRRAILRLRGKYSIHEIANIVGLRNSARVSEVLHGKR